MNKMILSISALGLVALSGSVSASMNNNNNEDQFGPHNVPAAVPQAAVQFPQNAQPYIIGLYSKIMNGYGEVTFMISNGSQQTLPLRPGDDVAQIADRAGKNLASGLPLAWVGTQEERNRAMVNLAAGLPLDWVSADRYLQLNPDVRAFAQQRGKNPQEWAVTHYKTTGKNFGFKYK